MVKRAVAIVTLALCALAPSLLLTPAPAHAAVDTRVSWGLDFLYARQRTGGGFALSQATANPFETPYAMYAITAGDQSPAQWKVAGKSAVAYLQSLDLEAVALATSPRNPPVYYAKCILAYRAAGRRDLIYYAGSKQVDLVAKLNAYRHPTLDYYSSQAGGGGLFEISTTAWAILALKAANEVDDGKLTGAASWLRTADASGGYPIEPGETEKVDATAVAVLALRAANDVSASNANAVRIASAVAFIKDCQKKSGGFTATAGSGDPAATDPTGWAVQSFRAAGISPGDVTTGEAGSQTPLAFLRDAQLASGAFGRTLADTGTTLATTTLGIIGLTNQYLPVEGDGSPQKPNFRPYFVTGSVKPANGATFYTRTVTVAATYADRKPGTGIRSSAIRVTVDGQNKTGAASISSSKLSLKLVNLSSGTHSVAIRIADKAGNTRSTTRSFTVKVATPTPVPTPTPTYRPPTTPTYRPPTTTTPPTVVTPTTTPPYSMSPYPSDPSSPYPYDSMYPYDDGYPYSPSPSPSGSSALGAPGEGDGGSWALTALAVLLLALVPIGALASYIRKQRLAASLGAAPQGKVLPGGGSAWERLKGHFSRSGAATTGD